MCKIENKPKEGFVLALVPVLVLLIVSLVFVVESKKLTDEISTSVNTLADQQQPPLSTPNPSSSSSPDTTSTNQTTTDSNTTPTQYLSATNDIVAAGYYAATTLHAVDADLTTDNIRSGITIFGVTGNSNVVNTFTGDAIAADLLSGKVAWVDGAEVTGTIPTQTLSAANDAVSAGYYNATTLSVVDTDLVTGNVKSGTTIFGVSGNSNVVNTSTGTATASDLLSGLVAWVDGAEVTGTMPTQILSAANEIVSAGYYAATTLSAVDTDLATGNIKSGITIFGVSGNSNVVNTSTGDAVAGEILSGKIAWVDGSEVTGTIATQTLSVLNDTVSAGYYNATTLSAVDTDLATGNIKSGVTIFGVAGNSNVVNTSTGTATAGDLLSGLVAWVDGAEVTGTIATQTLSVLNDTVSAGYYNATTLSAVDTDLATGNILSGKTIFGIAGNSNVVNTSTGDAIASDLLLNKIAWVDGASVTGTMPTQTLSVLNDTVSAGYYATTTLSAVDTDLATGNILSGTTIFGIAGNSNVVNTSTGDAVATDILSGKIAWVDGASVTGTMPTQTLSVLNDTVSAGYYNATTLSAVDTDLATGNILSGKTIFGFAGNSNVVNTSTGDAIASDLLLNKIAWIDGASVTGTYDASLLTAGTVKSGTAFGVGLTGDYPSSTYNLPGDTAATDAAAGQILDGYESWTKAGALVTGTVATQTLSDASQTVSAGYYNATTLSAVDSDLAAGNIVSGTVIFGITGTKVVAGACSTQQYYASHASATEGNNCSLTWTANASPVTGDDARSGRGGYDPKTGLTWSQYLKSNAGTVQFVASGGSTWNWNGQLRFTVTAANATAGATYTNNSKTFTVVTTIAGGTTLTTTPTGSPAANGTLTKASGTGDDTITFSSTNSNDASNAAVGGKTAATLCSGQGSGWRLPTQTELLQAYIDGAYWNLTQLSVYYWTATEYSSTNAYYLDLNEGAVYNTNKSSGNYVRCVR